MRQLSYQLKVLAFVLLAAAVFAPRVEAQVLYGTLVGAVQDESRAVIPGATVQLSSRGTGQSRQTSTGADGSYTFQNVVAGSYDVSVNATGFRTYTQEAVEISVNNVRRLDLTLQVGQVTENVTVEAATQALQTEKTDVHVDLTAGVVSNLPLPRYRNYQSLINLVPGASPGKIQNSIGATPHRPIGNNINGANRQNNITKLDGAINVFIWLPNAVAYVAPAETIETANISTNTFDAEQGGGGAAITVTTKSGTNNLHGTAWALHNNSAVGAKNFFVSQGSKKPNKIVNIDGFTAGGPIVKNKLFYFGAWEGVRERLGISRLLTLAPADQRQGDFSAYRANIYDPATGNPNGTGRALFPNNIVPPARQSAITRKLQDLVPGTNLPGINNNFFNVGSQALNRDNFDVKTNWNRTDRNQIWGKYSIMDAQVGCEFSLGRAGGDPLCQGSAGVGSTTVNLATIGQTWTISPTFVYDATIGWTRFSQALRIPFGDQNLGTDFFGIRGTNGPDPRQGGLPGFVIGGYSSLGQTDAAKPSFYNDTTWTTAHNFSSLRGKHSLRFGFEGIRHHLNHWQPELGGGGPRGRFDFNLGFTGLSVGPSLTQFNGMAAFLLGLSNASKSVQLEKMTGFDLQMAWYVRDRWQITPKLTATLGLRYERYPLLTRAGRGGIEFLDPETNIVFLGGIGGNPKNLGITTSNKLFAPRVGLAYRLNDGTVIRTGYGITYNPLALSRPLRGFYPLTIADNFNGPNGFTAFAPIELGIPELTVSNLQSGAIPLPGTAVHRTINSKRLQRGYIQSWNFIIERKLPGEFLGSVGYVGTQTVRSFGDRDTNAAEPGGGRAGQPYFGRFGRSVATLSWNGQYSANYHALQATINRRAAAGLTVKGAYTYSKAINMTDDDGWASVDFNIPSQLRRNRAKAGYDIPHIFSIAMVYELPTGKGKKYANSGPAEWILGNWQINSVFYSAQGTPFTVQADGAFLNAPGNAQTADQVNTEVKKIGSVDEFYDKSAFAPVNQVRFGNTGRNLIRGPGRVNLDTSLYRGFQIAERFTLQVRAEAFNLTNTPHFDNPNRSVNSTAFMRITSADSDERALQFGLRLSW